MQPFCLGMMMGQCNMLDGIECMSLACILLHVVSNMHTIKLCETFVVSYSKVVAFSGCLLRSMQIMFVDIYNRVNHAIFQATV